MSEKEFFAVVWLLALALVLGMGSTVLIRTSASRHDAELASLRTAVSMYEAMISREPNE